MELKAEEIFSIIQSLEARKEWIEDEIDSGCEHELLNIKLSLKKFKELNILVTSKP